MRIMLLVSVKDGDGWHTPGSVIDLDSEEAKSLILRKMAEAIDEKVISVDKDSENSDVNEDSEELSTEDIRELVEKLIEIDGVNEELAFRLVEAGFQSIESIAKAERDDLMKIKGIGSRNVNRIQNSAEDILDS